MKKSIDCLLGRRYHIDNYNCAHFLADAWQHVTGDDIREHLQGWLRPVPDRQFIKSDIAWFEIIGRPESPCIVVFQGKNKSPHVGLFYCNRVLHITESGVHFVPLDLARIGFSRVRFYR